MYKTMPLLILFLSLAVIGPVRADDAKPLYPDRPPLEQYLSASPAVEIALARTAGPKAVSDNATVLVLGKDGYQTAVKGTNGFVCYLGRSWEKDFDDPEFWNPHGRTPQCWNAAAASSLLPSILERAQWVMTGVSKDEMIARTKAEIANHQFVPAPASVVYMLSKDQYINDPQPGAPSNWHPHVMFFVPAAPGEEGSAWGANVPHGAIYSTTSDIQPITTYFVLSPRWSDGSLAPYVAAPAATTGAAETHHH
jgi:hypothetical protein